VNYQCGIPKFILNRFSEKQREIVRYWIKSVPAYLYRNNLSKLARIYGTDKYEHGYTPIYTNYFQKRKLQILNVLEIGIGGGVDTKKGGNSLKMWAKYFPHAAITGIDIYDKSLIDYRRIKTMIGSQSDRNFMKQFTNLDIVIDDGSHVNSDIIASFNVLFPNLNPGGLYCIEDTHTSGEAAFHNSSELPTIAYFQNIKNSFPEVEFVNFYNKIIIIGKRY
jgi:hypothetical protein